MLLILKDPTLKSKPDLKQQVAMFWSYDIILSGALEYHNSNKLAEA